MADFGFLMGLGRVNYAVIALRKRMPNLRRPFHAGFFPWIPLIGVASCWIFVPALELRTILLGLVLTLVGVVVPQGAAVAGRQIRAIEVPAECVVAAVIRGKKFVVPRGDTAIEAGDEVVFVGPASDVRAAQDLFVLSR